MDSLTRKQSRIDAIDVCKGICILMVILGHQFEKYGLSHPLQMIQTFHMPLFLMISGYFISVHKDVKVFVKDKIRRLLIPYLLCCVVVTCYKIFVEIFKTQSIECGLRELIKWGWISLYASGSGHGSMIANIGTRREIGMLWFLIALFWTVMFVQIIGQRRYAWLYVTFVSVAAILSTKIIWLPFSIQNGLGASFWVYLGCYVRKNDLLRKIVAIKKVVPILTVLWLISVVFGYTRLYACDYRLGIIDVVGDVCGCILIYKLSDYLATKGNPIKKFLTYAGLNSLPILCIHFIENNTVSAYRIVEKTIPSLYPLLKSFICWEIIVVMVIIVIKVLGKIKPIKTVLGIN